MQQKRGVLLAMPGTCQGKSGWYEMSANGRHLAIKYDVDVSLADEDAPSKWTVAHHPVKVEIYKNVIKPVEVKERERVKAAKEVKNQEKLAELASKVDLHLVSKMQAMCRRLRARRQHAIFVQLERRTLLACPGTTQGDSGWYERYSNVKERTKDQIAAASAGVGRTAVKYQVDERGWHLNHAPVSWEVFTRIAHTEKAAKGAEVEAGA
jgi:hypothetical protein